MSIKLSHIAIATPELKTALARLQVLALELEKEHVVPSEKVKAGMVKVDISDHFRLEYLEPTDPDSPIAKFMQKRPDGGIHHICFEVVDLPQWEKKLQAAGCQILPPGIRKAARGLALFVHPKSMGGVLVELEEISR